MKSDFVKTHSKEVKTIAGLLGLYAVARCSLRALLALSKVSWFQKSLIDRYGANSWAVVTGSSEGLGKGYCEELASRGFNIVFISRSKQKLQQVQEEFQKKFPTIKTKAISADFTKSFQPGFFEDIKKELQGLDISVLVNNVGLSHDEAFSQSSVPDLLKVLTVNLVPMVMLSKLLIPDMLKRSHRSLIINISSLTMFVGCERLAVYGGTKRFIDFFSRSLSLMAPNKVEVISHRCGVVSTPATGFTEPGKLLCLSARDCARGVIREVGRNKVWTFGHLHHKIGGTFMRIAPKKMMSKTMDEEANKTIERRKTFTGAPKLDSNSQ